MRQAAGIDRELQQLFVQRIQTAIAAQPYHEWIYTCDIQAIDGSGLSWPRCTAIKFFELS